MRRDTGLLGIYDQAENSAPAMKNSRIGRRLFDLEGRFLRTVTITSAAAATAVNIIADTELLPTEKVYVQGFRATVNGATLWATTATVKIQDTSAVDFVTMAVAALTGNAKVIEGTANVTIESALALGTGGTAAKGLQVKGDANGTGSDLVVTVWGYIAESGTL